MYNLYSSIQTHHSAVLVYIPCDWKDMAELLRKGFYRNILTTTVEGLQKPYDENQNEIYYRWFQ